MQYGIIHGMERYFNIAGPCNPEQHYPVPALERLPDVHRLVARGHSFAIHAARQSGKTTALMALVADINRRGEMRALYFALVGMHDLRDYLARVRPDSESLGTTIPFNVKAGSLGLTEGWMPIFDKDKAKPWSEKLFLRDEDFDGKTIHVVGL